MTTAPAKSKHRRLPWLLALALLLALGSWQFGPWLRHQILLQAVLRSETAIAGQVRELAGGTADVRALLDQLWNTGRVPHRLAALQEAIEQARGGALQMQQIRPWLVAGARDVDSDVREIALGALAANRDPQLAELARRQLTDVDPQRRLLGLQHLRRGGVGSGDVKNLTPVVMDLVRDPDPTVAASADSLLRAWTDFDTGVRLHSALGEGSEPGSGRLDAGKEKALREGLAKWADWWSTHRTNYAVVPALASDPGGERTGPMAADFALPTPAGQTVRLADYRGKVVLINFWATWCNACVTEIPDLVALQKRFGDQVVILGVSLDGRPEEHDHDHDHEHEGSGHAAATTAETAEVREKVARAVKSRGINYPVLLDPAGQIGARFNGGELPTNVLVDAQGRVSRRFIGTRSPAVLEAMLREAGAKLPAGVGL